MTKCVSYSIFGICNHPLLLPLEKKKHKQGKTQNKEKSYSKEQEIQDWMFLPCCHLHELKNVWPLWSSLPKFNIGSKCRNPHHILESYNNKRSNPKTFCLSTYWNLFQPINWFKTTKSLTITTSWIWRNNTVIVEIINMMQLNNGLILLDLSCLRRSCSC